MSGLPASAPPNRKSFKRAFPNAPPAPDLRIGVSNSVVVTIWEAAAGGLFSASANERGIRGSRTATLPEQVVARDGTIEVPYAGRLKVAGLRPAEVEEEIVHALAHKAMRTAGRRYDLQKPQQHGFSRRGGHERRAGTVDHQRRQIIGCPRRGGRHSYSRGRCFRAPNAPPADDLCRLQCYLGAPRREYLRAPQRCDHCRTRSADVHGLWRTGRNEQVPFDAAGITLEEAIAKAGGLLDYRADAAVVFLRFEPTALAAQLSPGRKLPSQGNLVPIVYRLNLRNANSFFLARSFPMHDKDMLYVSNSASDPVQKALGLFSSVVAPATLGVSTYGAVK